MHWPRMCAGRFDPMKGHRATPAVRPVKRRSEELRCPLASSEEVRARMRSTPQRDTPAELRIRKLLYAKGLRYSIDARPLEDSPRRADILFRRAKIAVFVDGCFWHGCPKHGTWPKANEEFWRAKLLANRERDANTNNRLRHRGWLVIRVWEHTNPVVAGTRIARRVRSRSGIGRKRRKAPR